MSDLFISKRDWTYNGRQLQIGEVFQPTGSPKDVVLFGDNTHWTVRLIPGLGSEPLLCDTDGCSRKFATLGQLQRHRRLIHAPEREDRFRFQREHAEVLAAREQRGETIGGYEVTKTVHGPGGDVPYVKLT